MKLPRRIAAVLLCLLTVQFNHLDEASGYSLSTIRTDVSNDSTTSYLQITPQFSTSSPLKKISIQSLWPIYTHPTTTPPHYHYTRSGIPLSTVSPGIARVLQQLNSIIPGFQDSLNNRFGLSASELGTIFDFVKLLMEETNTNPSSLMEILESVQSSNLFTPNVTHNTTTANEKPYSRYQWGKCQLDMQLLLQGVETGDDWALQMLDASAKPGSSILKGNLKFMGNYKECQDVSYRDFDTLSQIEGNICRAFIKLPDSLLPTAIPGQTPRLQWDVCLPKSCFDYDLNKALRDQSLGKDIRIVCTKDLDIMSDKAAVAAIAVLSIFGALLVAGTLLEICMSLTSPRSTGNRFIIRRFPNRVHPTSTGNEKEQIIVATVTELSSSEVKKLTNADGEQCKSEMNTKALQTSKEHIDVALQGSASGKQIQDTTGNTNEVNQNLHTLASLPRWQLALLAFSIPRNTEKIFSVKSAPGTIGCLHGIRVLSMAWVILGHTIMFRLKFENSFEFIDMIQTVAFQIIINAPLSVDTFFVMSGLLTCYIYLKTLGKKGKISTKEFIMYYVHRYWSLTPSLIIWIMIVACLMQYVGEGRPGWTDYPVAENCRNNWWINILYINNVYKHDQPCVGVTWYLANDMQFYIVAPLAMIPWVYGKKILGYVASFVLIGIHLVSTFSLELKYNADMLRNQKDYSHEIYFKPYTRVAPFAIGLILGWVLWTTKGQVKMNKVGVLFGWITCFGFIALLTLVTHDENSDLNDPWSKTGRVLFETLNRPLWAVAISWMIYACALGYGGYINAILYWEGWLPLSRLTYSVFIVHLTIVRYESMLSEYTILFTLTSLIKLIDWWGLNETIKNINFLATDGSSTQSSQSYTFIGYFVMAYAVGYLLTVTVQSPMLALEKVFLGQ